MSAWYRPASQWTGRLARAVGIGLSLLTIASCGGVSDGRGQGDGGTLMSGGDDLGTSGGGDVDLAMSSGRDLAMSSMPDLSSAPSGNGTVGKCGGVSWFLGDVGSNLMHPGVACIACHAAKNKGPMYTAAGTVMKQVNDPDDCQGVQGVTVTITDANGADHNTSSNFAGNFYTNDAIPLPFTAKVSSGGRTRVMTTPQMDLDCNNCHTALGLNGAPGRIQAP